MTTRSFFPPPSPSRTQRGFPMPGGQPETRAAAGMPWPLVAPFGGVIMVQPRRSDMGAAGFVMNFGKVLTDPIGAGVVAPHRPQAYYGQAGQYIDHTIFWAQRTIPTTIPLGPLTTPAELQALLGRVNVQAAIRVG